MPAGQQNKKTVMRNWNSIGMDSEAQRSPSSLVLLLRPYQLINLPTAIRVFNHILLYWKTDKSSLNLPDQVRQ